MDAWLTVGQWFGVWGAYLHMGRFRGLQQPFCPIHENCRSEDGQELERVEADDPVPQHEALFRGEEGGEAGRDPLQSERARRQLEAQQMKTDCRGALLSRTGRFRGDWGEGGMPVRVEERAPQILSKGAARGTHLQEIFEETQQGQEGAGLRGERVELAPVASPELTKAQVELRGGRGGMGRWVT
jgi:hypothetical protein